MVWGLGGSLETVIVYNDEGWMNPLNFPNELVRHKILDVIGDIRLAGMVRGHIIAVASGHALNTALAKEIAGERGSSMTLDINEIQKILPHRPPMLLVDRIIELEPFKSATGIKCVTMNEPFFLGHFRAIRSCRAFFCSKEWRRSAG